MNASAYPSLPPQRALCPACLRAQRTCICRWIARTDNLPEVLILQHPMEVANAKGSARLLHLGLARSRLEVGEQFAPAQLAQWLGGDAHPLLLYPGDDGPPCDPAWLDAPQRLRLVVLDGTWRKSRKMLHLNPQLAALPRLPLRAMPASHYLIRKAHLPDQLSTLEATAYALARLEGDEAKYRPLIAAFDGFVAQLAAQGHAARAC
ncbi:tRNA-uridine aminocarboxypropyltransferase [Oxalobacteraceae bacterium A2-2]